MPIAVADKVYEDELDYAVQTLPPDIRRIIITGEDTKDEGVVAPEKVMRDMEQSKDPNIIWTDGGEPVDYLLPGQDKLAPREPADALKPDSGHLVPQNDEIAVEPSKGVLGGIGNFLSRLSIVNPIRAMMNGPNLEEDKKLLVGMYDTMKKAFQLPGDVYGGKIDPMSQQGIERAFDLAGIAVLGPAPVARKMADGTLGSFAGVRSAEFKGKKLNDLGHAQIMESNGVHKDKILSETGMFRGADGRWRYEIDDSKASVKQGWYESEKSKKLPEVLDHPELYRAYPQLKKLDVVYDPDLTHAGAYANWNENKIVMGPHTKDNLGIVMHELQHIIQNIEGFAGGGAPMKATEGYRLRYQKDLEALKPEMAAIAKKSEDPNSIWTVKDVQRAKELKHIVDRYQVYIAEADKEAFQYYMRMAGEVESRNVDIRLLLPENIRRNLPPYMTQDTDRLKEIIMPDHAHTTAYGVVHPKTGHIIKPASQK